MIDPEYDVRRTRKVDQFLGCIQDRSHANVFPEAADGPKRRTPLLSLGEEDAAFFCSFDRVCPGQPGNLNTGCLNNVL
ncbi:hypothetical protein D3C73_1557590 [compost metagenome]